MIVASTPAAIDPGLRRVGLMPVATGWTIGSDRYVRGNVDLNWARVYLRISGNGAGGSPWTISGEDIGLAEHLEHRLAGADWIRFW